MTRDKNWERFWSTGSVLDYLAYKGKTENSCMLNISAVPAVKPKIAVSCTAEGKNEVDHTWSDSKGTDGRRKG